MDTKKPEFGKTKNFESINHVKQVPHSEDF